MSALGDHCAQQSLEQLRRRLVGEPERENRALVGERYRPVTGVEVVGQQVEQAALRGERGIGVGDRDLSPARSRFSAWIAIDLMVLPRCRTAS